MTRFRLKDLIMKSKLRTIAGTAYAPMRVWEGDYHSVRMRFRTRRHLKRDRGFAHVCVQNAAGFGGTRRLTKRRAYRGKWHAFEIHRRGLARQFLIDVELLVLQGAVEIELDGEIVTTTFE